MFHDKTLLHARMHLIYANGTFIFNVVLISHYLLKPYGLNMIIHFLFVSPIF